LTENLKKKKNEHAPLNPTQQI